MQQRLLLCLVALFSSAKLGATEGRRSGKLEEFHCGQGNYTYDFTECSPQGERWRVAIPTVEGCTPPVAPIKLDECYKSCKAGQFLNLSSVTCEDCQLGSYSMGGGVRFDEWDPLPTGFKIQVEEFRSIFKSSARENSNVNCTVNGWHAKNNVLISHGGPCVATLTYATELVKPGILRFVYQYSDDTVLFQAQVTSGQCDRARESDRSRWPPITGEGVWRTEEIPLHLGTNVFEWKTMGLDNHATHPIIIKMIEIEGVGYTSSCLPCPPGYFSDRMASKKCTQCPRDTYSDSRMSTSCRPCDTTKYYAEPGSSNCIQKVACTSSDYYQHHTTCDSQNQMNTIYKWIEPKICIDDGNTLPPMEGPKPCPPCNPGTEYRNGECIPCSPNMFSDGLAPCQKCPSKTVTNNGYFHTHWYILPSNVHTRCISPEDNGCSEAPPWQLYGNYIQSGNGHASSVYLVLTVSVPGFRGRGGIINGELLKVGSVDFDFEMRGSPDCEFLLMQSTSTKNASVIQRWTGNQRYQTFSLPIVRNDSYNFSWAFQKRPWDRRTYETPGNYGSSWSGIGRWNNLIEEDWVKIYTINITNTISTGGDSCIPCHTGGDLSGKIDSCVRKCEPGFYRILNPKNESSTEGMDDTSCIKCPHERPVTKDVYAFNESSCFACGPNLISHDGFTCTTDCIFKTGGNTYDLRPLKGFHEVRGTSLFTASGTLYYHVFNISFCGNGAAQCYKNVSLEAASTTVDSLICQSTVFPPTASIVGESYAYSELFSKPLSTHATSIADHIVGISHAPSILGISVPRDMLKSAEESELKMFHFFYSTPEATSACPKGRSTTITFRCDPEGLKWTAKRAENKVQGPRPLRSCPDGTCDGCNFHFEWNTPYACHLCKENEVTMVRGECNDGYEEIHYLPLEDSNCFLSINSTWSKIQKCKNHIPLSVKLFMATLLISFVITLYCYHRKHRKLEYKYMKLVASSGNQSYTDDNCHVDKNLPVAETCALDSNDEDEDDDENELERHCNDLKEVRFYDEGPLKTFVSKLPILDKFKAMKKRVEKYTGEHSEILSLTDKEALT